MAKEVVVLCGAYTILWERFVLAGLDRPLGNAAEY
jgi:hypothetical protein